MAIKERRQVQSILEEFVTEYFEYHPADRKTLLLRLSKDKDLWIRRSSIVSIVSMRGEISNSLKKEVLTFNLGGDEFFINKAIGWFLREEYFYDQKFVLDFCKKYPLHKVAQREVDRAVKGLSQSGKPLKRRIGRLYLGTISVSDFVSQ